jgi:adenine/guanine phosphoribosyltransferase-like PRPP-binding protein
VVRELAAGLDVNEIDYVLGFPEGGVIPAFAFAHLVDRPLILSSPSSPTSPFTGRSSSPSGMS